MSKLIVHTTHWYENDERSDFTEWDGDFDAQLHTNGCLIVVEYAPSLDISNQQEKKAKLVAIYNKSEWDRVEVK